MYAHLFKDTCSYSCMRVYAHAWRHSHTPSSYRFLLAFPIHISICSYFLISSLLINIPNIETFMISFRTAMNMISLATRRGFIYPQGEWAVPCTQCDAFITCLSRGNIKSLKLNPKEARAVLALPSGAGCLCFNKWGAWNWTSHKVFSPSAEV